VGGTEITVKKSAPRAFDYRLDKTTQNVQYPHEKELIFLSFFTYLRAKLICMSTFFVDPDISRAKTISTEFYTSSELFESTKEKIFALSWQYVGHEDMASEVGDQYPLTLLERYLDEPLVLTRDRDHTLRLLSNVCTHRGNIVTEKPCQSAHLRCRYHGRVFNLDGGFRSMPEFQGVEDFPSQEDDLKELPLSHWGKWLFTSLRHSMPADLFLADMRQRVAWMPIQQFKYRPDLSRDFVVKAHWALYCENYLEGFHIPFVHANLNAVIDFGKYTTELFGLSSLQLGMAKEDEDCFLIPPGAVDEGKKVAAYYFFVFPNMMFNFYPWGLSVNLVQPLGLSETKVSFYTYLWDQGKYNTGAGSSLDVVELEDEQIVEQVQQGIRSRFYQHGRYSVTREQGTHHFHRMLASFLA
jgi:choline monooxygenase